ncbi:universal stress protein [Nafulsella turpanensis]|uniref:universal stress protein n=1 Tax=Nafulsella turpanensis TaxID=1265690 RepID=UPI00034AFB35|nr:universal stress protein [Nafulsella turpanensis]
MEKILVLTDFSDIAKKGLETAVRIARQLGGAEILLLNTELSTSGGRFSASGDIASQLPAEEDRYMVELIRRNQQRLQEQGLAYATEGVEIRTFMEIGEMQEVVDDFLKNHEVDLIVMGTSGENTLEEYFLGNHTEQVIRVADVPVLSVKVNDHIADIRNVVWATDMNKKASASARLLKSVASKLRAKLHLLHVTKSSKVQKSASELEAYAREQGLEQNYSVAVIDDNDVEDGIKRYAAKVGADMIAVITHGRDGLSALLSHSVAEDVIREASVPVLTINMHEVK